jgi:hypothetical protein
VEHPEETRLQSLFAEAGAALELLRQSRNLLEIGVRIAAATSVDSVMAQNLRAREALQAWRIALARVSATSAELSSDEVHFASTLAGIEEQRAEATRYADSLGALLEAISQNPDSSLEYFNLLGFEIYKQATPLRDRVYALYALCQRFAVLDFTFRPAASGNASVLGKELSNAVHR